MAKHKYRSHTNKSSMEEICFVQLNRFLFSLILFLGCFSAVNATDFEVESTLRSISNDLNKSLPIQIDREKMLEVTVALHYTLLFKYKFTDETVINSARFSHAKYLEHLRTSLGEPMCTNSGTIELFRRGAKYEYLFINKRGLQVISFKLDEKTCKDYVREKGGE